MKIYELQMPSKAEFKLLVVKKNKVKEVQGLITAF